MGILKKGTVGLIGPSVDLAIADSYSKAKGIPLNTLTRQDLDFFDLGINQDDGFNKELGMEDSDLVYQKLIKKGFGGEYKLRAEHDVFYKNMNSYMQNMLTGDINKMLSKHAIDILNTEYGFKLPIQKQDFENIYLKGRCEVVTPGKEFG